MRGTSQQFYKKFDDAMRAVATFNGAGIAGVIALAQRSGPIAVTAKFAGVAFSLGLLGAIAMWVFIGVPPRPDGENEVDADFTWTTAALYSRRWRSWPASCWRLPALCDNGGVVSAVHFTWSRPDRS